MKIFVIYQNGFGIKTNISFEISRLGLLKHFGSFGLGKGISIKAIVKGAGISLHYHDYFWKSIFNDNFSKPNNKNYSQSEISDFSTLVGFAISDFLARRINNASHVFNYEAAMLMQGFPITVSRPDLYCFNSVDQFAIEAKGYSDKTISDNYMKQHKIQSQSGPLLVNFSIASVTFNIYKSIKNKYYDPVNINTEYNSDLNKRLSKEYYSFYASLLNAKLNSEKDIVEIDGNRFFKISYYSFYNIDGIAWPILLDNAEYDGIKLLVTDKVFQYSEEGNIYSDSEYYKSSENIYIDNDGIGLYQDKKILK